MVYENINMIDYLYKLDTNFFENPINKRFQSDRPIEWE